MASCWYGLYVHWIQISHQSSDNCQLQRRCFLTLGNLFTGQIHLIVNTEAANGVWFPDDQDVIRHRQQLQA